MQVSGHVAHVKAMCLKGQAHPDYALHMQAAEAYDMMVERLYKARTVEGVLREVLIHAAELAYARAKSIEAVLKTH